MLYVPITYKGEGYLARVDDEDFDRVMEMGPWYLKWDLRKNHLDAVHAPAERYQPGMRGRKMVKLHRFVLNLKPGDPEVDHRDRDPLNNQKNNLRLATRGQNCQNVASQGRADNTSGYRGVTLHSSGLWHARHQLNKKSYSIGYFKTAEEAGAAAAAWRSAHYTHSSDNQ